LEEAIAEYASYLRAERGLAAGTIEHETVLVRPFLAGRVREGGLEDLESLTSADVQAFVLTAPGARRRRGSSAPDGAAVAAAVPAPAGVTVFPLAGVVRRRPAGSCPAFPGT